MKGRDGIKKTLDADLVEAISKLVADEALEERHHDHALTGNWKDHRDCHIKPDLVLIYRKPDDESSIWCASVPAASSACSTSPIRPRRRVQAIAMLQHRGHALAAADAAVHAALDLLDDDIARPAAPAPLRVRRSRSSARHSRCTR